MNFITGETVSLRQFTRENYHEFQKKYVSDPIMDNTNYQYDFDVVEGEYDRIIERFSWYKRVGIFLNLDESVIGTVSFKRIDFDKRQCEIGITLANDSYKAQGYGTEAFQLALKYATQELKLTTILADTMGTNVRMQKIFDRMKFELISRESEHYNMGDRLEDRLNYVYRVTG